MAPLQAIGKKKTPSKDAYCGDQFLKTWRWTNTKCQCPKTSSNADQLCIESDQIYSNGMNKLTSYFIMHVHGGNQTVTSICGGTQMRPLSFMLLHACCQGTIFAQPLPLDVQPTGALEPRTGPLDIIGIRTVNVVCAHDRLSLFYLVVPVAFHHGLRVCFSGELVVNLTKDQWVAGAG